MDYLLLITNLGTIARKNYSKITFIPARNKMIEIVQAANIPLWCLSQVLVADYQLTALLL